MSAISTICLSLAGNNDAGDWRGKVEAAQVASLRLAGDDAQCRLIGGCRLAFEGGLVVQSHKHIPWHGNMAWDAFWVSVADAIKVVELLRGYHWTCEEGESELFDTYNAGEPITAALIEGAADETL